MYNVLIVEDDPMVAMINEQYTRRNRKFSVVGKCADGESALDFLAEHPVDLIFLDVYMPKTDGFDALREIRRRKIPAEVIMITAANDREALEEALHLGVVDYLVKPFTYERFCIALEKFISKTDSLREVETLNQKSIDFIIENNQKKADVPEYRKGIQERTLELIGAPFAERPDVWMTSDEIAAMTGLSAVTVRRYLNYLTESGVIIGEMNYETGGRPSMLYRLSERKNDAH